MNTNKANQDHGKHDKNAPKQNQSQTPTQGKGREDGQAKGSEGKSSMPDKNKQNKRNGK
jgi:hypothetical protein